MINLELYKNGVSRQYFIRIFDIHKQGPQGPQKLSSLKSQTLKTPSQYRAFSLRQPSEMAFLSKSGWQNCTERQNPSINNGYIVEKAKRP